MPPRSAVRNPRSAIRLRPQVDGMGPVAELCCENLVVLAAIDHVKRPEVAQRVIAASDFADDRPVELQFKDFASGPPSSDVGLVRIRGGVEILVRTLRDAESPGTSNRVVN